MRINYLLINLDNIFKKEKELNKAFLYLIFGLGASHDLTHNISKN
jgi:hypothetical protein